MGKGYKRIISRVVGLLLYHITAFAEPGGAMDVFTFLVGGKAGEGVKKAGNAAADLLASRGLRVFQMDDYQSLIKGGHNFSVVSASKREITSHYMKADLIVNLDARSYGIHKDHLTEGGITVYNSDVVKEAEGTGLPFTSEAKKYPDPGLRVGLGAVAALAASVGMTSGELGKFVSSEYRRDLDNNLAYSSSIYEKAHSLIGGKFKLDKGGKPFPMLYGNEAIALGAAAGGLDIYIAYPMTPASSILHVLASHSEGLKVAVVHPENEIAVANIAIGAASAGARAMVGSSGGGFALMEEALSLAGMTETPLLCILSSRPGPSTGVPTYTEQADLRYALGQGHGEFPMPVASPGSSQEAFYLSAELLALAWKFQTPAIMLTDKHTSESRMSVDIDASQAARPEPLMHSGGEYKRYLDAKDGISPLLFSPSKELVKWNSYEHDEKGITTDTPEGIARMHEKRRRKAQTLHDWMMAQRTVNAFGDGDSIIFTYGSTTMSVLEAVRFGKLKAKVVQPIYLEPFPVWELAKYRGMKSVSAEMNSTGQFATLLREKAGIAVGHAILKYDGRPFEPAELAAQLKGAL
jgi:2-oxoglutarate ferredoxin oxidoreductase subunit alpha